MILLRTTYPCEACIREDRSIVVKNSEILPGSRVLAFDSRLYKDDKSTPLSVTMKVGTVVRRYGERCTFNKKYVYPDLIDIKFDYDLDHISRGHFTDSVEVLD